MTDALGITGTRSTSWPAPVTISLWLFLSIAAVTVYDGWKAASVIFLEGAADKTDGDGFLVTTPAAGMLLAAFLILAVIMLGLALLIWSRRGWTRLLLLLFCACIFLFCLPVFWLFGHLSTFYMAAAAVLSPLLLYLPSSKDWAQRL
jgi:hypothetical protein